MTLDRAIIHLMTLHKLLEPDTDQCFLNAIKLGIETLKLERQRRKEQTWGGAILLPGETEE